MKYSGGGGCAWVRVSDHNFFLRPTNIVPVSDHISLGSKKMVFGDFWNFRIFCTPQPSILRHRKVLGKRSKHLKITKKTLISVFPNFRHFGIQKQENLHARYHKLRDFFFRSHKSSFLKFGGVCNRVFLFFDHKMLKKAKKTEFSTVFYRNLWFLIFSKTLYVL